MYRNSDIRPRVCSHEAEGIALHTSENTADTLYRQLYAEGSLLLQEVLESEREAQLDARLLLEHVCGTGLHTLLLDGDRSVDAEKAAQYRKLILRRYNREPLAYITGQRDFMGLTLEVSRDVLIPEQDSENLVEEVMKEINGGDRILDLCTGSGCILLSLLHYSNGTVGIGTDLSEKALAVAALNAEKLNLSERVTLRCGDLFDALEPDERFDIIVSNPPYIRTDVISGLAPEVKDHEPLIALDGGEDGLDFYRRIIPEASVHLVTGGLLFLEIGYDQADEVASLMKEAGYYDVTVIKDYGGNDRIVRGIKSIHQN